jgi:soluble lytic murein transglycosylase-like protein
VDNSRAGLNALIASHASANGVPESLVHRVIVRESRYNSHVVGRGGAMGLMQIKTATARGLGYTGSASGLLDPETNLTYAVRYLAGAYQLAGGNENRAVSYYARGYYYAAKRQRTHADVAAQRFRS